MTAPRQIEQFDQFYKDVRARLLLLTYCLTGDLAAARAAVRDTYVVAWHHWRKVSRLDDPESWVRERACRDAQRRHTAKLWHRERGLAPEVKATLDALGRLPMTERRMLLGAELTSGSLEVLAREVGLPRAEAERQLQRASATFALERGVPTTGLRSVLEQVGGHLDGVRLPRPTIVRRAGATRRRTHTLIGGVAATAALVVTGTLVTADGGAHPTLAGERVGGDHGAAASAAAPAELVPDDLLDVAAVTPLAPHARWSITGTDDNSTGSGLRMACQQARYAGPRLPSSALVRTFDSDGGRGGTPGVVQAVEAAPNDRAARRAYATAVRWFATCQSDRPQLVATYAARGIGDGAMVLSLRTWNEPHTRVVAGIARSGRFTVLTSATTLGTGGPGPAAVARVLAGGVDRVCHLDGAGTCGSKAGIRPTDPVPAATTPAMLAEVDLPPVQGLAKSWVGTQPRKALDNAAATTCDGTSFRAMRRAATRTFLIPQAKLPTEFGLTESIGTLPQAKAEQLVATVRDRLAGCEKKQMGTKVTRLRTASRGNTELSVWRVRTEVSDNRTISFLMGIVRDGGAVAQVGFVPGRRVTIRDRDFEELTQRALDRLSALG